MSQIWETLGIAPVRDRETIRRAYARRLKMTNPEDDAEAFGGLRTAYEEALASLAWDWYWDDDETSRSQPPEREGREEDINVLSPVSFAADAVFSESIHSAPLHVPILSELHALLLRNPPATPDEVERELAVLMQSPTVQEVATQVEAELRVLELILDNIPRSDALVKPAIKAFGWTRGGVISRRDSLVDAVLDRESDIGFRKGISSAGVQLHAAYKSLSSPINAAARWRAWLSPMLDQDIRVLFREIDTRRPSLAADLDPGAYAWWRERLSKPGLAAWMVWLMSGVPVLAGVVFGLADTSFKVGVLVWGGAQFAAILFGLIYVYAYARPRDLWMSTWAWRAPALARMGWAPASWLLLLIATVAPSKVWSVAAISLVGTLLLAWCIVTRDNNSGEKKSAWLIRSLLTEMFLIVWWIMLSIDPTIQMPAQVQIAAVTAILVSMIGAYTLIGFWYGELREVGRRFGLVLLIGAFALAVALLFGDLRDEAAAVPVMTIGFISALVLATRPAALAVDEISNNLRARVILPGLFFGYGLIKALSGHWLAAGGIWMLLGSAITLTVAGLQSVKDGSDRRQ